MEEVECRCLDNRDNVFNYEDRTSRFFPPAPRAPRDFSRAASSDPGEGLVRRLGLFDLVLLGVGASIGSGIFVITGTVARDGGPGVTLSFVLAAAACVLNALCYAELASRFPAVVGGAYMYSYTAFNEITAFLVFTQLMMDYHIGAASIARSLASYLVSLLELFPFLKGHFPSWIRHGCKELLGGFLSVNILVPIILMILIVVLCRGVNESSTFNSIVTTTKDNCDNVFTYEDRMSRFFPPAPRAPRMVPLGSGDNGLIYESEGTFQDLSSSSRSKYQNIQKLLIHTSAGDEGKNFMLRVESIHFQGILNDLHQAIMSM